MSKFKLDKKHSLVYLSSYNKNTQNCIIMESVAEDMKELPETEITLMYQMQLYDNLNRCIRNRIISLDKLGFYNHNYFKNARRKTKHINRRGN